MYFVVALAMLLFCAPAFAISLDEVLSKNLVVDFIEVGVGDAILIQTPIKENEILIDGGDRRKGYNSLNWTCVRRSYYERQ